MFTKNLQFSLLVEALIFVLRVERRVALVTMYFFKNRCSNELTGGDIF